MEEQPGIQARGMTGTVCLAEVYLLVVWLGEPCCWRELARSPGHRKGLGGLHNHPRVQGQLGIVWLDTVEAPLHLRKW